MSKLRSTIELTGQILIWRSCALNICMTTQTPCVEYLDWPVIPESLYPEILASLDNVDVTANPAAETGYRMCKATKNLEDFVKQFVPAHWVVTVQEFTDNCGIHKDHTRRVTHNFLIELGGPNVITSFYTAKDRNAQIEAYRIEKGRWHRLQAQTWHAVDGVCEPFRISVSAFEFDPQIPEAHRPELKAAYNK